MHRYAIHWLCAFAMLVFAGSARATFHLWQLNEIYSNADGTVQFIELITGSGSQQFLAGRSITSSQGATMNSFVFPSDLPGDTAGRTFLIGTTGFAALGLVTPDYIVPNGFLFTTNGSVNFAGVDSVSWAALPVDGTLSIDRNRATAVNSPKNFAGATGSVPASFATIRNALFINASTSGNKTSVLRLINTSNQSGAITATAYDEAGSTVGTSNVIIGTPAARQMLTFTSAQLEAAIGYTASSSTAKYRIVFTGNLPSFEVINFIKDVATGNLTLGQAQVDNRAASSATTSTRNALFVNASTSTNKTTVLRLINLSDSSGSVTATAYDEAGNQIGVSNASIGILAPRQMLSFTSAQLEAAIGFTPATTTAKYRIVFSANLNSFEVLNFIKDVATGSLTLGQEQID